MERERLDLEGKLRAGRSTPRADFAAALAGGLREASGRARQGRIGLMLALAGLIVVAVVSFGSVSYASSSKPAATKHGAVSAAGAQYAPFTPKTKPKAKPATKPAKHETKGITHTQQTPTPTQPPKSTSTQLPFTGLTLWVPLAIGLLLIATGATLRTRARRRTSGIS